MKTKLQGNGQKGYFERTTIAEEKIDVIERKVATLENKASDCSCLATSIIKSKAFMVCASLVLVCFIVLVGMHYLAVWPFVERMIALLTA